MAPDDRDAFGNPVGGADGATAPAPIRPTPDLGAFAPPVAPAPTVVHPPAPQRHVIASGHPLPGGVPAVAVGEMHPGANTALALGVAGMFLFVLAPFAWWRGRAVAREIDASGGRHGGRGLASAAQFLGFLGTCLLLISLAEAIRTGVPGH
jgi:hypothetical protein